MKGIPGISALGALLFGSAVYLILSFLQVEDTILYALLAAALFFLALSALLRISLAKKSKQYMQLEQQLQLQYFHKSNGNFDLGNGDVKNGNIYFGDTGIFCLCLDEKPYELDVIEKANIARMDFEDIHLRIQTWDGRQYRITLSDAQTIRQLLRDKGW